MYNSNQSIWDPIGEEIKVDSFFDQQYDLLQKYNKYQNNPSFFQNMLILCIVIIIAAFILEYIYHFDFHLLALSFMPIILLYPYVKKLQEKLIVFILCKKYNWIYNPKEDFIRTNKFIDKIPNIFNIGHEQNFSEQIWGSIQSVNDLIPFWSCDFEYTTGSGKSSHAHSEQVFVFKLEKTLEVSFTLDKESGFNLFKNEIQTEYEDFNKIFLIQANANDIQAKNKIFQILSPSVQTRLIDLVQKHSIRRISFYGDLLIIFFDEKIWKTKYTNFFKNFSVDLRDEDAFNIALTDMIKLPTEMIQFI